MSPDADATPAGLAPADLLLVVDVQRGLFAGPEALPAADTLLTAVGRLITTARDAGAPVVFLQNDGRPGAIDEPTTPGWRLCFDRAADDVVVRKTDDDGFVGTRLDDELRARGAGTLAVVGALSEMCLATTVRAALRRGYRVVLPHDGHGTYHVPSGPGSDGVPAALAARAAEWSLGDEVQIVDSVDTVTFRPAATAGTRGL